MAQHPSRSGLHITLPIPVDQRFSYLISSTDLGGDAKSIDYHKITIGSLDIYGNPVLHTSSKVTI